MRNRSDPRDPEAPWWKQLFTRRADPDCDPGWRLTEDASGKTVMILEPNEVIHRLSAWSELAAHVDRARRALMDAILEDPARSESLGRDRRNLYLACGVCPGCAYDLRDLPLARPTVTCPECGRAWVIPQSVPI